MKSIYRYVVPVDDRPHEYKLTCNPVAVAVITEPAWAVEFWAENTGSEHAISRYFQVFGTGHPIPGEARYAGTCPRARGAVFHLYEVPAAGVQGG